MPGSDIPSVEYAIVSGSAGWGRRYPDDLADPRVTVIDRGMAFETPYGPTDRWQLLELNGEMTVDGRPRIVLNVFAHGWRADEIDHGVIRCVGWVLQQAGVTVVVAESTCGSLNRAVLPGDFVIPRDVIDLTQTPFSVLPGRIPVQCRGAQLVCPALAGSVADAAEREWPAPGRVLRREAGLVVAHTWGPRLETPAEANALRLLGADLANQSIAVDATLAREIGACFAPSSYIVNFVDGVNPEEWGDYHGIHDRSALPAMRIGLTAIAAVPAERSCRCDQYRRTRPERYLNPW
ncbi:hypothetical protein K8Z49_01275 [Actinomadura madurae]|uniref:phosphorylase family protein n=1 Tax=Actinomadura madurae TaxID=1993 RepID=UPI00399C2BA1